ncbi:MAG TPA: DNA repair protein RecO [Papillibacter sp.]|jgi:DNA repair protein RecO (recombination protein O)|nr:DNA repair protein RecO [Papillibacter sp.]
MYINTTGLVLREAPYRESSKILTVLTATHGKITVSARGARRRGSRIAAAAQPLMYSEMTLYNQRDRYTLTEAQPVELFPGLTGDLVRFSLGAYFAELLEAVAYEDVPNPELLAFGLNALYLLGEGQRSVRLIKAVFELRLMLISGYAPNLSACVRCRQAAREPILLLEEGTLSCLRCKRAGEPYAPLCEGSLEAMGFVLSAPPRRAFSFRLEEPALSRFASACEAYALQQLGRRFRTLEYYKQVSQGEEKTSDGIDKNPTSDGLSNKKGNLDHDAL